MLIFDLPMFLAYFPEFADEAVWKPTVVQSAGYRAMRHITTSAGGMPLIGEDRDYAQFLMAGHLLVLDKQDEDSGVSDGVGMAGTPFKATVGSVQVENTKPNSFQSDDWNYWLNQTKYGRELLAFLDVHAPGIFLATQQDSVRDLP